MPDTPQLDLERLERLAKEATPGPWMMPDPENENFIAKDDGKGGWDLICQPESVADLNFIAAYDPETCLALIARLREADALIQKVRTQVDKLPSITGIVPIRDVADLPMAISDLQAAYRDASLARNGLYSHMDIFKRLQEAEAKLAAGSAPQPSQPAWVSVETSMPENGETVWVVNDCGNVSKAEHHEYDGVNKGWYTLVGGKIVVKYWQRIVAPAPPVSVPKEGLMESMRNVNAAGGPALPPLPSADDKKGRDVLPPRNG